MANNYVWANAYWNFFHIFSYNMNETKLNEKNIKLIHIFINTLVSLIPCDLCKIDTTQYFENKSFKTLKTKKEFVFFFYEFHNYVNKKTRKNLFPIKILNKYNKNSVVEPLKIIDKRIYKLKLSTQVYKFFLHITS